MDALNREFVRLLAGSGWSQSRAARELHLDTGTVSRYVSGDTRPSMTVLKLFAELLRETVRLGDHLYTPSFADDARPADASENEMLRALRRLPLVKRQRLIDYMMGIAALLDVEGPTATGIRYSDTRSGPATASTRDAPAATDSMPGIDPVVADTAREGALIAQRMLRAGPRSRPTSKAVSPSGNKSGRAGESVPESVPQSERPTPAPGQPSSS